MLHNVFSVPLALLSLSTESCNGFVTLATDNDAYVAADDDEDAIQTGVDTCPADFYSSLSSFYNSLSYAFPVPLREVPPYGHWSPIKLRFHRSSAVAAMKTASSPPHLNESNESNDSSVWKMNNDSNDSNIGNDIDDINQPSPSSSPHPLNFTAQRISCWLALTTNVRSLATLSITLYGAVLYYTVHY